MFFRREPLPFVAPLQLKGCTRIPSLCSTTTPLEASGPRARFVLVPSTSTSGSNRRVPPPRGFLLAAHPRAFPSGSTCRSLVPPVRRQLMPRFAACGPVFGWVRSPFFVGYFFLVQPAYLRGVRPSGADGCAFPSAIDFVFVHRFLYVSFSVYVYAGSFSTGAAGRVSRPCSRTSWRTFVARSMGSLRTWQ